jgi:hypothetical protein
MMCQKHKPTRPTFDDLDQPCGIIDDVAYTDVANDLAGDTANDCT